MRFTELLNNLNIITKFLVEKRPYGGFTEENLVKDTKEILKGTLLVPEWARKHTPEKPNFDWQCPICGYSEYPDWCPLDFYVANGQIYPKREKFWNYYNYDYGVNIVNWDETHFCPYCKKEYTFESASA